MKVNYTYFSSLDLHLQHTILKEHSYIISISRAVCHPQSSRFWQSLELGGNVIDVGFDISSQIDVFIHRAI